MRKVALCLTTLLLVFISLFTMVSCGEDPFFHDVTVLGPDGKEVEGFSGVAFYDDGFKLPTLKDLEERGIKRPEGKILAYRMDGKELDINTESVKVSSAVTIEAYWTDGFYITYDSNNDTGETKLYAVKPGQEVTLNDGSLFTMDGRKIGSWNTAKDASGTKYELSSSFTGTKDITLYAKWRQIEDVVVTYDANGATEGTAPAQSAGFDPDETNITIADQGSLKLTGMTFIGWNTKADGTGTEYQPGSVYTGSVSLTLYAHWATGYSITYHYKNASNKDVTFVEVTAFGKAPVYAKLPTGDTSGWALDAWYEESTVTEDTAFHIAEEEGTAALTANIDLYGLLYDEDVAFDEVNDGYSAKISEKGKAKTEDFTVVIPSLYHGRKVVAVSKDGFHLDADDLNGYPIVYVTIPDTVTTIGDYAFRCTKLSAVTIPASVTSIGIQAFYYIEELSAVEFNGKELKEIQRSTFAGSGIESITIPEGVEKIADGAFQKCTHLTDVSLPSTVTTVEDNSLEGCSALKEVRIYSEDSSIYSSNWGIDTTKTKITWGKYSIGDKGPAGGIIFYRAESKQTSINGDGVSVDWWYLEAAPEDYKAEGETKDRTEVVFGFYKTSASGDVSVVLSSGNSAIGTGGNNTRKIADAMKNNAYSNQSKDEPEVATNYAIKAADDYEYTNPDDGKTYTDWFLPSKDEYSALLTASKDGKIDFAKSSYGGYFSYWTSTESSSQNAYSNQSETVTEVGRANGGYVRAVRYVPVATSGK